MSKEYKKTLGYKQGSIGSGEYYKVYAPPVLETLDQYNLGVWIGPVNSSVSPCADDLLLNTDTPSKLQAQLDIAGHWGELYRIQYNADKTKVTITGSQVDRRYYKDVSNWTMNGDKIEVTENYDHLGQIISGDRQEEKNMDLRL